MRSPLPARPTVGTIVQRFIEGLVAMGTSNLDDYFPANLPKHNLLSRFVGSGFGFTHRRLERHLSPKSWSLPFPQEIDSSVSSSLCQCRPLELVREEAHIDVPFSSTKSAFRPIISVP